MRLGLTVSAAALLTAAASMAAVPATAAHAAGIPAYFCNTGALVGSFGVGSGNCIPANGAAPSGPLSYSEFEIVRQTDGAFLLCVQDGNLSGIANTPTQVTGFDCTFHY